MPEFVRVRLRRTLECTLILRHIMVLLRIRVNVPLTLTRGPGKHETKKRQTDMDILLAPPSPQRTAQYWAGNYLDDNTSSEQGVTQTPTPYTHHVHPPTQTSGSIQGGRLLVLRRRTEVGGRAANQRCLAGNTCSGSSFSEPEFNFFRVTPDGDL